MSHNTWVSKWKYVVLSYNFDGNNSGVKKAWSEVGYKIVIFLLTLLFLAHLSWIYQAYRKRGKSSSLLSIQMLATEEARKTHSHQKQFEKLDRQCLEVYAVLDIWLPVKGQFD